MTEQAVIRALRRLYQIADAGEKGFATAAVNMPAPALKILFKLYAQQRLTFKLELQAELNRLGVTGMPRASLLGAVHRGRVAIFAGMSTDRKGQEGVILKEAALGERVALRAYRSALEKDLPAEARALVERQLAEVQKVSEMVRCLRADERRREAVRVSPNHQEAGRAVQALVQAGFRPEELETQAIHSAMLYQGKGATLPETLLSGAVGGALWGGLMGAVAGVGVIQSISLAGAWAVAGIWLLAALGFALMGAGISTVLALFIGLHIAGEDSNLSLSLQAGAQVLVQPRACEAAE